MLTVHCLKIRFIFEKESHLFFHSKKKTMKNTVDSSGNRAKERTKELFSSGGLDLAFVSSMGWKTLLSF